MLTHFSLFLSSSSRAGGEILRNEHFGANPSHSSQEEMRKQGIYTRTQDPKQSTEFTYCRFFVPYLNNYKGWAMFVDDDFLWLGDMKELIDQIDDKYAVMCATRLQTDRGSEIGRAQEPYPRKNWSSMVLYSVDTRRTKA